MKSISIDSNDDMFVVSIDKNLINKDLLLYFIDNLRTELAARRVNFGEDLEQFGEEIKEDWWRKNKDRFIPKEEQ